MSLLTHKDLHWFHLANAAPDYFLKRDFYAFKRRFLARHATPDGYDLQIIQPTCWTCDGTGTFCQDMECRRCAGTGVYGREREIILCRFDLVGRVYHIPTEPGEIDPDDVPIKNEIEGLVKHTGIPDGSGRRSYFRLLLRHEPMHFYHLSLQWLTKKRGSNRRLFRLIRLRNGLDLFPAIDISTHVTHGTHVTH